MYIHVLLGKVSVNLHIMNKYKINQNACRKAHTSFHLSKKSFLYMCSMEQSDTQTSCMNNTFVFLKCNWLPRILRTISMTSSVSTAVWSRHSSNRIAYSRVCSKVRDLKVGVASSWIDEAFDRVTGKSTLQAAVIISDTPGKVNCWWYLKYCSIATRQCSAEAELLVGSPLHCWSWVRVERNCCGVATGGSLATLKSDMKWSATSLFVAVSKRAAANDAKTSSFIELEKAGSVKNSLKMMAVIQQKHQSTLKQAHRRSICHSGTELIYTHICRQYNIITQCTQSIIHHTHSTFKCKSFTNTWIASCSIP